MRLGDDGAPAALPRDLGVHDAGADLRGADLVGAEEEVAHVELGEPEGDVEVGPEGGEGRCAGGFGGPEEGYCEVRSGFAV